MEKFKFYTDEEDQKEDFVTEEVAMPADSNEYEFYSDFNGELLDADCIYVTPDGRICSESEACDFDEQTLELRLLTDKTEIDTAYASFNLRRDEEQKCRQNNLPVYFVGLSSTYAVGEVCDIVSDFRDDDAFADELCHFITTDEYNHFIEQVKDTSTENNPDYEPTDNR